jgi:dihydrodipicolinate synthase/N-acetylneuraminate lyase
VEVIHELRDTAPNLCGMKVSDTPWEAFAPYLIQGLDVFVGPEMLIHRGMAHGAVGAVSALATAFPEAVAEAVRTGSEGSSARLAALRADVERFPRHATLKRVLAARGVPIAEAVRPPLRGLTREERAEVDGRLDAWLSV